MRCAVYARMSSDLQSKDSPADQVDKCREFIAKQGWTVAEVVEEPAVSGVSLANRPGLQGLLARMSAWDAIVVLEFSRLTRDVGDYGSIMTQCREAGRTCVDATTGRDIFDLASQMMGVLNSAERLKIAEHTRRGLFGRAKRGFATGAWRMGT